MAGSVSFRLGASQRPKCVHLVPRLPFAIKAAPWGAICLCPMKFARSMFVLRARVSTKTLVNFFIEIFAATRFPTYERAVAHCGINARLHLLRFFFFECLNLRQIYWGKLWGSIHAVVYSYCCTITEAWFQIHSYSNYMQLFKAVLHHAAHFVKRTFSSLCSHHQPLQSYPARFHSLS